jgi:hypothetical protein
MKVAMSFTCAAVISMRGMPFFRAAVLHDRHDQLAVLVVQYQLRSQQIGPVSPPRASDPWQNAQATP